MGHNFAPHGGKHFTQSHLRAFLCTPSLVHAEDGLSDMSRQVQRDGRELKVKLVLGIWACSLGGGALELPPPTTPKCGRQAGYGSSAGWVQTEAL